MSKLRVKTTPDLSETSSLHLEAKDKGNDHYRLWEHNVADRFKDKTEAEVKVELKATAQPFAVCFEHWIGDFNMGSGIRNANAFNAKEVFYLGERRWDKRSAVGVYNYTDVQFIPTMDEFRKLMNRYNIVGVDNVPGSVSIDSYKFVPDTLFVFGEEGVGITPAMQDFCDEMIEIPMYGSVRSLNCGVASGIVMHEFVSRVSKR